MRSRGDMNNKVNDIYQCNKNLQIIIIIILSVIIYICYIILYIHTYICGIYMYIYVLCKYMYTCIYKNASVSDSVK